MPACHAPRTTIAGGSHAALLEKVYDRIDHIIGVERYDDETPPKVHYTAPGSAGGGGDAGAGHRRLPLGLHVDTNSTGTYATAILYLTTLAQPDADGGEGPPVLRPGEELRFVPDGLPLGGPRFKMARCAWPRFEIV